jgi:hypothetical protein
MVTVTLGQAAARTTRAGYETAVALVNSASDRFGCGAKPLVVPKGDVTPPDPEKPTKDVPVSAAGDTACGWVTRTRLPRAAAWRVTDLMNDAAPAGRCDLSSDGGDSSGAGKSLRFAAWYGDWSNRLVSSEGVRRPLTATARCAGEAANFALDASKDSGVAVTEQRRLLRAFAADQVERRGCSELRLTV